MSNVRYRRSSYLLLEWGDDKQMSVVHLLTTRRYQLDPKVVVLLNTLSEPRTLAELSTLDIFPTEQLARLLTKLCTAGLIEIMEQEQNPLQSSHDMEELNSLWSSYELAMHLQASRGKVRDPLPSWPAPRAHRDIASIQRLTLPSGSSQRCYLSNLSVSEALQRRTSIRHYAQDAITFEELGIFLATSARVFNFIGSERHQTTHRPSASAGARHSLEIYALCRNVTGLSPAIYYYDPFTNELAALADWNAEYDQLLERLIYIPAMLSRPPDVAFYITSVVGRVFWKYEGNGLASIYRDMGCLLQTMYLVATDLTLAPCAVAAIDQPPLPAFIPANALAEIHVGSFALGRPAQIDIESQKKGSAFQ